VTAYAHVATLLPRSDTSRVETPDELTLQRDGFAPDVPDHDPNDDEVGPLPDLRKDSNGTRAREPASAPPQPSIVTGTPAALGDRVWHDANGRQDAGEAGVAGVAVDLYARANGAPTGTALATTTTDTNGNCAFTGLMPGPNAAKF